MPARSSSKAAEAEAVEVDVEATSPATPCGDVATCWLRTMRPDDETWAESVELVQVRALTNCSKAAKPLAFDGEMDADADADGGDDGDGDVDVDAALEANVPCCNSPKREQRGTTNRGSYNK